MMFCKDSSSLNRHLFLKIDRSLDCAQHIRLGLLAIDVQLED